ncbi:type IX secretion system motor protein PorM/GldM [Leeuwenhoekiella aequorea]|uniref:Protein involved in gliding motility GldM n=1 Tax=Leeuwenhoekiella aequorea TaxID=283736 RepID=A0A4Q0P7X1_9FLAO|nr:gliding motility protein GldM [Leeuwenhoekiella aequorea]RXG22814.1 protein involved in gliding motility GldM [Leeuwenhoekiella aequorea]
MAGGTQSPRQKMINLMYLVFIAMIAMNVDKEILNAFKIFDVKFTSSNARLAEDNQLAMAGLEAKAEEQPAKYRPLLGKAEEIKKISDDFYTYLASIKDTLTDGIDTSSYANLDKTAVLDERWFTGDRYTKEGDAFLAKIESYKSQMQAVLGEEFADVNRVVQNTFAVEPQTNKDGKEIAWLRYNFEGYPLAASITRFTQMQNDIRTAESEVYSSLLQGQLSKDVSLSNYQAIVVADKTAFFSGENFKGKVVLGRFDNSLNFDKVVINGSEVENLQSGQVVLDFPAGNVGTRTITGELVYTEDGEPKSIPISSEYAVINRPNSATISADKMNVVYRGVANPMTISFAGVPDNSVSASGAGLTKQSGSSYIMNPGGGNEVTISVSGTMADGSKVSDSKRFRIKDIPSPTGTLRGEDGILKMQRNALEISTVGAKLLDFDFDLDLNVTGFKFNVPGEPTVQVNGNKLDSRAKDVLRRAQRGSTVQIFDITAQISGNSGYRLKKVAPVLIELTN